LQTRTKFVARLIVVFLACGNTYAEEIAYLESSEPCRVAVYPAPDGVPLSEKLQCGEKVSVLEQQGDFARIQLNEDKIVWVEMANITTDVPAEQEVMRLMENQKKLEAELDELNNQVEQLSETSRKLINALIAAEAEKKK
jgi:hypothetical protein